MIKRFVCVAQAAALLALTGVPALAQGETLGLSLRSATSTRAGSDGSLPQRGFEITFTGSARAKDYTFTLKEKDSGAALGTVDAAKGDGGVFLPADYDVAAPKSYLLEVTANVDPQRAGFERPHTVSREFEAPFSCGCPSGTAGGFLYGDGETVPFAVASPQQLQHVNAHLNKKFVQVADLDLGGYANWTPLGGNSQDSFTGTYDGNGYTVSGLTCTGRDRSGLFGAIEGATVQNLGVVGASLSTPRGMAGAIAAGCYDSALRRCFALGGQFVATVQTAENPQSSAGGLVSQPMNSTVEDCYAAGITLQACYAGGLAGSFSSHAGPDYSTVRRCYAIPYSVKAYGTNYAGTINGSMNYLCVIDGIGYQNITDPSLPALSYIRTVSGITNSNSSAISGIYEVTAGQQDTFSFLSPGGAASAWEWGSADITGLGTVAVPVLKVFSGHPYTLSGVNA